MTIAKRLLSVSALALLLAGCSTDEANETEQTEQSANEVEANTEDQENEVEVEEESDEEGSIEVDKGMFRTEMTLPAEMVELFDPEDLDDIEANATQNEDGSLTIKMSRAEHKEIMNEMANSIEETADSMLSGEDFSSFKSIDYNDDFSEFSIIVDQEDYESGFDVFGTVTLAATALYYQVFDGVDSDSLSTSFEMSDEESGEVFESFNYPDDMEDSIGF